MSTKKPLNTFALIMINIIAIANLRSVIFSAEFGLATISVYLLAALFFLFPVGLVVTELATTWPSKGGLYVWIKQAFGPKAGLFVIWIQWIFNVTWFPIAMAFIVGTIGYIFHLEWTHNKDLFLILMIGMFWCATLANCFGMKVSSAICNISAIFGTLIPMLIIISFGIIWLNSSHVNHLQFSLDALFPSAHLDNNWPFLVEVIFGLVGLEITAMHADQVINPAKTFPKTMFYSVLIILCTLVLSSLSIATIVPNESINHITGVSKTLDLFLQAYHLEQFNTLLNLLIILGSFGGITTWIIGPAKGLLVAAEDGLISPKFKKTNKHSVPVNILITQAVLFTLIGFCYVLMPNLESAYLLLTAMTTQLSLIIYIGLFAAIWKLRKIHKHKKRPYKVKFLKPICILGILTCVIVIGLGFIPPAKTIGQSNKIQYITTLILGVISLCIPPIIYKQKT